jgi:hypothetical protein
MNSKTCLIAKESPGLYGSLKRIFKDESILVLEEAFNYAYKLGSFNEDPIVREAGVSFNPRPARFASILIKEAENLSLELISSAFFIGVNLPDVKNEIKIINVYDNITSFKVPNNNAKLALFLVCFIDLIRHLHMSSLRNHEKSELINNLCNALKNINSLSFEPFSECNINIDRLKLVLETAIRMQEHRLVELA